MHTRHKYQPFVITQGLLTFVFLSASFNQFDRFWHACSYVQSDAGGIPLIYAYMLSGGQNTVWCKQCQFLQSWNAQKKKFECAFTKWGLCC